MASLGAILLMLINVAITFIFVHVVMSWLISFNVLNVRQPLVAAIWNGLGALLEPAYRPLRRVLPATRGVDFAPLAVLLILSALGIVVRNNLY